MRVLAYICGATGGLLVIGGVLLLAFVAVWVGILAVVLGIAAGLTSVTMAALSEV